MSARNEHAPHCHLWPAQLCNIFFTLSHKRHYFRESAIEYKMCFHFLKKKLSEAFLILRRTEGHIIKNLYRSLLKCSLFLTYFNEAGFFYTVYQKIIKFYKTNSAEGVEVFHEGRRMDGQT